MLAAIAAAATDAGRIVDDLGEVTPPSLLPLALLLLLLLPLLLPPMLPLADAPMSAAVTGEGAWFADVAETDGDVDASVVVDAELAVERTEEILPKPGVGAEKVV